MCLIINKPAHVDFGHEWLRDFWQSNRDGAGIMWLDGDAVNVEKITSPTCEEWIEFYDTYARKNECVIHLRMRTHGAIDDENTHPYHVGHGYFLMHNGILSSGNAADRSKSDTWHFIQDVLRPALRQDRKCLKKSAMLKEIGELIGRNNRMVILGRDGKSKVINSGSGVVWNGAWFSNTYAWSAPRIGERLCETVKAPIQSWFVFDKKQAAAPIVQKKVAEPKIVIAQPETMRLGPALRHHLIHKGWKVKDANKA